MVTCPAMKQVTSVLRTADRHWVGDGFPVRTLFAYSQGGDALSPFLLLDYAGPAEFQPTGARRGVNGAEVRAAEAALFERAGTDVAIEATADATALLLSGQPIDYQTGRMGHLA